MIGILNGNRNQCSWKLFSQPFSTCTAISLEKWFLNMQVLFIVQFCTIYFVQLFQFDFQSFLRNTIEKCYLQKCILTCWELNRCTHFNSIIKLAEFSWNFAFLCQGIWWDVFIIYTYETFQAEELSLAQVL